MPTREQIKATVRARDNFCCTRCGTTQAQHFFRHGRQLEVHRIVPGSLYSVDACVTLCRPCHDQQPRREPGQPDLGNPYVDTVRHVAFDPDLVRMARVVCAERQIKLVDYLDAMVREQIVADYQAQRAAAPSADSAKQPRKPRKKSG